MRRLLAIVLVLTLAAGLSPWLAGLSAQERGQDDGGGASFITPFPENDTYRLWVIGDSYAEGLLVGLPDVLGPEQRVDIPKRTRNIPTLMRAEIEEDSRSLEEVPQKDAPHIAVVMIGARDRVTLRPQGRALPIGSPEWRDIYGRRVDRIMKALKRKRIATYWVGLPVVARPEWNDDVQMMNEIIREKAFVNGVRFIDVYAGFADEGGEYSRTGPDITGRPTRLREADGILFTEAGNRKLAHFLERELRRDLGQARQARAIPLLGSDEDQKKIAGKTAAAATAKAAPKSQPAVSGPAITTSPGGDASGGEKADNSRIQLRVASAQGKEEVVTIDIVRPAIPANVLALVTRGKSADQPAQLGDTVTDEIAGGIVVMSSITPATEGGASGRRKLAPTQLPFFRVLVKGERMTPKPGRADDFSWPRPPDDPEDAKPAVTARPKAPPRADQRALPSPRI